MPFNNVHLIEAFGLILYLTFTSYDAELILCTFLSEQNISGKQKDDKSCIWKSLISGFEIGVV